MVLSEQSHAAVSFAKLFFEVSNHKTLFLLKSGQTSHSGSKGTLKTMKL
jgi:hypothetical protein